MFQVPISAPTASRMNTALSAELTPLTAASRTVAPRCPFLNAIRAANAALSSRATCSGPSVADVPNNWMVDASSRIRTPIGNSESGIDGRGAAPGSDMGMHGVAGPPGAGRGAAVVRRPTGDGENPQPGQQQRQD